MKQQEKLQEQIQNLWIKMFRFCVEREGKKYSPNVALSSRDYAAIQEKAKTFADSCVASLAKVHFLGTQVQSITVPISDEKETDPDLSDSSFDFDTAKKFMDQGKTVCPWGHPHLSFKFVVEDARMTMMAFRNAKKEPGIFPTDSMQTWYNATEYLLYSDASPLLREHKTLMRKANPHAFIYAVPSEFEKYTWHMFTVLLNGKTTIFCSLSEEDLKATDWYDVTHRHPHPGKPVL